ncbi:TDT family transporter [Actinoplanes sp. NPDC049596]|uniref:TDT family transporter n=1 Tax=unclassified Actinoplanes TaxID=2626549 RepID=UPI00344AACF6
MTVPTTTAPPAAAATTSAPTATPATTSAPTATRNTASGLIASGPLGVLVANFGPNWFASVMGTGIVATAAVSLPVHLPGLRLLGVASWALAVVLLIAVSVATVLHWRRHPRTARRHHLDPVMAHFYGAPPMALMTVGAATLLAGRDVIGETAALAVDWTLWTAGTIGGLLTAIAIPYLQFTRHDNTERAAFGGWLMPVVPPMVSASTGALLLPYLPEGQPRLTLLVACYAMFGLSLIASFLVIPQIWQRLTTGDVGPARLVPTLWIVLGPLGQSITAANLLGGVAHLALPPSYADPLRALGLIYGIPVLGFALLWIALAAAITIRTARSHLPFTLTWWSFTFPVGTCVTGTSALAAHTGSTMLAAAATVLYAALLTAWAVVATRTTGAALRGTLVLPSPAHS